MDSSKWAEARRHYQERRCWTYVRKVCLLSKFSAPLFATRIGCHLQGQLAESDSIGEDINSANRCIFFAFFKKHYMQILAFLGLFQKI